jgi:hypothetical protein
LPQASSVGDVYLLPFRSCSGTGSGCFWEKGEIAGGIILVCIGLKIFIEHTFGL